MDSFLKKHGYSPKEDYVVAHLQWITDNKNFVCREHIVFQEGFSYLEIMNQCYYNFRNSPLLNRSAFVNYIMDKLHRKQAIKLERTINKAVNKLEPTPNGLWFVTIGFDHALWSIPKCVKVINNIMNMQWVVSAKANFEFFREKGTHPHVHFIIETLEARSRIVDKLFRSQYVKKVVSVRNAVQVQPMMDYHLNYINLIKVEEKMVKVNLDREWRLKNNIPDFEKNWDNEKIKAYFN